MGDCVLFSYFYVVVVVVVVVYKVCFVFENACAKLSPALQFLCSQLLPLKKILPGTFLGCSFCFALVQPLGYAQRIMGCLCHATRASAWENLSHKSHVIDRACDACRLACPGILLCLVKWSGQVILYVHQQYFVQSRYLIKSHLSLFHLVERR
jgi:hypothetical protein